MKFLRTPHFKEYVENLFVWSGKTSQAWDAQKARDMFKETYYEDFNSLFWVMENVFPNSRRNGDDYEFITGDITHTNIKGDGRSAVIGKFILTFNKQGPILKFENPNFRHKHVTAGVINCWGGYLPSSAAIVKNGFASALMDLHNFATVSEGSILPGDK